MGSALETLKTFPSEVQDVLGYAIDLAQAGRRHPDAKPLTGDKAFRGAGVLEAVDRFDDKYLSRRLHGSLCGRGFVNKGRLDASAHRPKFLNCAKVEGKK